MDKEFVPYELAVKLKALGFDEECFGSWWFNPSIHKLNEEELQIIKSYYFGLPEYCILAPTFSQVFRWFRENYGVHASPRKYDETKWWVEWGTWTSPAFETFEEAELSWLTKLIELTFKSK